MNNVSLQRREARGNCLRACVMPNRYIVPGMSDNERNEVQTLWDNWSNCNANCQNEFPFTNAERAMRANINHNNHNNHNNNNHNNNANRKNNHNGGGKKRTRSTTKHRTSKSRKTRTRN